MNALKGTRIAILAAIAGGFATVSATPVQAAEIVPQAEIENTYGAQTEGRQLYRAKKYAEAIPVLGIRRTAGVQTGPNEAWRDLRVRTWGC